MPISSSRARDVSEDLKQKWRLRKTVVSNVIEHWRKAPGRRTRATGPTN